MRNCSPAISGDIAKRARLNERYVRGCLGALLTSGVVEFEPSTQQFFLQPEHSGYLTLPAGADNIGVFSQNIASLRGVEDDIVACFQKGRGVPYSRFPRFHEVMEEDSGQSVLSSLETHILPLVPGLTNRLADGARVLDVGCGRGRVLI
jgi:hypothetical protein